MTKRRKEKADRLIFHNMKALNAAMISFFDIDLFADFKGDAVDFLNKMLCRRHVHEHNGGEVDEKYLRDSGDTTVRIKQALRETPGDIMRTISLLLDVVRNLHVGFHDIFEPEAKPIAIHRSHSEQAKARSDRG
jgi:hypothetical protein